MWKAPYGEIKASEKAADTRGVAMFGAVLSTDSKQPASTPSVDGEDDRGKWEPRETDWPRVLWQMHVHFGAAVALLIVARQAALATLAWALVLTLFSLLGVTAGAHRLWAHRSYTAAWPLRVFLAACHAAAGQGSIYDWVLEHRIHHKYHGTDLDPFNYRRGFFFSQIGNRLLKPHPRYQEAAATIDMKDIEEDPVAMLQHRFYWPLFLALCCWLPVQTAVSLWSESPLHAAALVGLVRFAVLLHATALVASGEQLWSLSSKNMYSVDSNLVFWLERSHWPRYHYLLPWDYRTGEFGGYGTGCTSAAIRVWAALGWASGLRTVGEDAVRRALADAVDEKTDLAAALEKEGWEVAKKSAFLQ